MNEKDFTLTAKQNQKYINGQYIVYELDVYKSGKPLLMPTRQVPIMTEVKINGQKTKIPKMKNGEIVWEYVNDIVKIHITVEHGASKEKIKFEVENQLRALKFKMLNSLTNLKGTHNIEDIHYK